MAGFTTPVLASSMLANALLNDNSGSRVIKSGCQAIDQGALNGGFRHGEITAIAGCSGTGKTTVSISDCSKLSSYTNETRRLYMQRLLIS